MKRTFAFQEGGSQKFWSIEIIGSGFTVTYGKLGTAGQSSSKIFTFEADCKKEAEKLIREKASKGYKEIAAGEAMPERDLEAEKQSRKMGKERFWAIVDKARKSAEGWEDMAEPLEEMLLKLDADEIFHWGKIFELYNNLSYKNKLWAAAYVIGGGCSDDGFDYFRGWLIAQGKKVFFKALCDPDSLAGFEGCEEGVEFEEILYTVANAYSKKLNLEYGDYFEEIEKYSLPDGEEADITAEIVYAEDIDAEWEEDEETLKKLLPRLSKKFG